MSALDQKAAAKLLPAYVKRGRLEEKVVLGAIEKETFDEAFAYLKKRLDPEEDIFVEATNFCHMVWGPGEPIQDFFTRFLEEGIKVGLSAKAACVFMVSRTPAETQPKLKYWVKSKGNDLSEGEALQFSTLLRKVLTEKGVPLDHGCRVQVVGKRATSGHERRDRLMVTDQVPMSKDPDWLEPSNDSGESEPPKVQRISQGSRKGYDQRKSEPLKCCTICGEPGHKPHECPFRTAKTGNRERSGTTDKRRVFLVAGTEEAVMIEVSIGPDKVGAMLDTGARPSVMDISTACRLDLPITQATQIVYGLCNNPVKVMGYTDAPIGIGERDPLVERIQVLESEEPILLLCDKRYRNNKLCQ